MMFGVRTDAHWWTIPLVEAPCAFAGATLAMDRAVSKQCSRSMPMVTRVTMRRPS